MKLVKLSGRYFNPANIAVVGEVDDHTKKDRGFNTVLELLHGLTYIVSEPIDEVVALINEGLRGDG